MGVIIPLTSRELMTAALQGAMRTIEALEKGQTRQYDPDAGRAVSYQQDFDAAAAEIAAAKFYGAYPMGISGEYSTDCVTRKGGFEVRHSQTGRNLIIRQRDMKDHPEDTHYVLVTGTGLHYEVHGYATMREVIENGEKHENPGEPDSWWLDKDKLHI